MIPTAWRTMAGVPRSAITVVLTESASLASTVTPSGGVKTVAASHLAYSSNSVDGKRQKPTMVGPIGNSAWLLFSGSRYPVSTSILLLPLDFCVHRRDVRHPTCLTFLTGNTRVLVLMDA